MPARMLVPMGGFEPPKPKGAGFTDPRGSPTPQHRHSLHGSEVLLDGELLPFIDAPNSFRLYDRTY